MTKPFLLLAGVAVGFTLAGTGIMNATDAWAQQPLSKPVQSQPQQADKDSQSFIKKAIEGNIAEVDVGKLAEEKSKSEAVKKFGQMLVEDHSKALEKAKAAAGQAGVEPPSGSSLTQKGTYAKLKLLQGEAFDKSFANAMVSDHQNDIKEYEKAAGKNNAAGHYAKEALPTLRTHLQHAKALQQELKRQTTGSR
jgi:putative membrane protein